MARAGVPALGDLAVAGRLRAGLADLGIQPEIGDELTGEAKRPMSPIAATSAAAVMASMPGIVINRRASGEPSTNCATLPSINAISVSRKSIWRRQPSTVSCSSSGRSWSASQRRPALPNRSLAGGRPSRQREMTAWTSFLARVRCRTQRRAAGQPPAQGADALVADPHLGEHVGRQQPRQGRRVEAVGLHPRVADCPHLLRVGDDDPSDVRPQDPRDGERRAGRLQHHLIVRRQALREQLKRRRRRLDPRPVPNLTALGERHLAEIPVHVQSDATHPALLFSIALDREAGGHDDNYGFALAAQPGKSQGRPVSD
jgi:hypothetical protein